MGDYIMRETKEQLNQELLNLKRTFLEKIDLKELMDCTIDAGSCLDCAKIIDCLKTCSPSDGSADDIVETIVHGFKKYGFLFYEPNGFIDEVRDENIATSKTYKKVVKKLDKHDKIQEKKTRKQS